MKLLSHYPKQWLHQKLRMVDVPDDISSVTDIDYAAEVDPVDVDLTPESVAAIWEAQQDLYRSGAYPLLSLCLRRRGEIVLHRSIGHSRDDQIASIDTPICLFSASKAVTAILIHLLAEQGKINLLDPVSHYIPAFAANGKGSTTILQLLNHRAGVPSVPEGVNINLLFDHDAALELICQAQPTDNQGSVQAYHAITTGFIFNELIKVTTGLNSQQFLDRYISKPMGMRYFRYGLTKRDQADVALNTSTGLDSALINKALANILGADPDTVVEMTNDPRFYRAIIPSVNLFSTAEEASRFFQMLLNNGKWQGKKILDPLTVHRATRPLGPMQLDRSLKLPMRYSAGFMLGGSPAGIYGLETPYAYGHLGYANIFCWADPERDIAVSLMNTGKLGLGAHLKALPLMLNAISAQCEPIVDMAGDDPHHRRM